MNVPIEEIRKKMKSNYQTVIVAARRTRQLADGASQLVDVKCVKPTTLALWEIASGKVKYSRLDNKQE